MKFRLENKYLHWGITGFCVIAASLLFYYGIFRMHTLIAALRGAMKILTPIIYGAILAYLLNPISRFFEKKVFLPLLQKKRPHPSAKGRKAIRYLSVLLSLLFFGLLIYTLLMMIFPELIKSVINIINSFPRYLDSLQNWFAFLLEKNPEWSSTFNEMFNQYSVKAEAYLTQDLLPELQEALRHVSAGVFGALNFLKNFLVGAIVSIYILADKEGFAGKTKMLLYAALPTKNANHFLKTIRLTHRMFGGFISGKLLDSAIIGLLCYIGTSILNMPYAVLISVVVGVTNIIPFFGPYLGAVPCALLILLIDPLKCLYFIIFILVLQQFDGNILGPKILGDSTGLSSFMVIVAILIGGGLFGVFGMLVGVPVCAVLYTLLFDAVQKNLRKRSLPEDPELFSNIDYIDAQTKEVHLYQKETETKEAEAANTVKGGNKP